MLGVGCGACASQQNWHPSVGFEGIWGWRVVCLRRRNERAQNSDLDLAAPTIVRVARGQLWQTMWPSGSGVNLKIFLPKKVKRTLTLPRLATLWALLCAANAQTAAIASGSRRQDAMNIVFWINFAPLYVKILWNSTGAIVFFFMRLKERRHVAFRSASVRARLRTAAGQGTSGCVFAPCRQNGFPFQHLKGPPKKLCSKETTRFAPNRGRAALNTLKPVPFVHVCR